MNIKRKIKNLILDTKNGIINLWIWFPTIWNDYQWDHVFIYKILYKKFSIMEKYFYSKKPAAIHSKKDIRSIKICRILLERLLKDEYFSEEIFWIGNKKKTKRILDHADMLEKQDIELLFKTMNRKITCWWD